MAKKNVAELLLETLAGAGVERVYGVLQPTLREECARLVRAVARTMQKTGGTLLQGQATGTRPQAQQGRTRFPVVRQRTPPCIRSPQWPLALGWR